MIKRRFALAGTLLAAIAFAGPGPILVVADSLQARAARLGLRAFGRTAHHLLIELDTRAGVLPGTIITPSFPLYLLSRAGPSSALIQPPLFRDGDELLVQLDDAAAAALRRGGAEMFRVSERPFPVRVPENPWLSLPLEPDTLIQRLCALVSPDSIHARLERLQAVRTRYSATDSCRASEQYLYDYLLSIGLDSVALDSYPAPGDTWRNVVGTKLGRGHPEKVLIVCGHLDATSEDSWNLAPGMEDNGSGTCVAIEAARVLCREALDYTIRFIAFTGEEISLNGSDHYAREARSRGEDILAAFNFDMVSWPGGSWGISLVGLPEAAGYVNYQARMASLYTPLANRVTLRSFPSDSRSFENQGYLATSGYEYGSQGYIWYHTTGDTLGNISMPLAADVTRMAVATLASLALAPLPPAGLVLADAGNGSSLVASWLPNTEPDIAGYKLLWGLRSRSYTDSLVLGATTSCRIDGLLADATYYAAIVALDSAGHQSASVGEASAVPTLVPRPPASPAALPFFFGAAVHWQPNSELDLAGYNLSRRTSGHYVRLNSTLIADTLFRDSSLLSDTMYRYVVTAVDSAGHESDSSAEVRTKPVTLDHGILLVDETRNGSGQQGSPSDVQQDQFYHALLQGYRYSDWDVTTDSVPLAGDVGPYSTIVWHADDYSQPQIQPALPGLANYLGHGGRLWLVGWKPVAALMGNNNYPFDFVPGQFAYDRLHLRRAEESQRIDFIGASGAAGYPGVTVDSTKTIASLHGRLPYIDALLPRDAEAVLSFTSASGDSFQGKPVGVRWLGAGGRVVCFGFPLYYTREDEARALAQRVLADLGEFPGIAEERGAATSRLLVLPTVVRGKLLLRELESATLLDIAGRRIAELHRGLNDMRGIRSGVYFVRTTEGNRFVRVILAD